MDRPGKHPKTGKPAGKMQTGGNEGNKNGGGGKKGQVPLKSDEDRAYAAFLIAEGYGAMHVCEKVGVSDRTLWRWRKEEKFLELVAEAMEKLKETGLSRGFSEREARVEALNNIANGILTVFKERAEDNSHMSVPGFKTGLMTHEQKSIGAGALATVVDVYRIDTPATREFRDTIKQIAIERGQWTEKTETSFDLSKLSEEELKTLESVVTKIAP